jgi:hypothetical protein
MSFALRILYVFTAIRETVAVRGPLEGCSPPFARTLGWRCPSAGWVTDMGLLKYLDVLGIVALGTVQGS